MWPNTTCYLRRDEIEKESYQRDAEELRKRLAKTEEAREAIKTEAASLRSRMDEAEDERKRRKEMLHLIFKYIYIHD